MEDERRELSAEAARATGHMRAVELLAGLSLRMVAVKLGSGAEIHEAVRRVAEIYAGQILDSGDLASADDRDMIAAGFTETIEDWLLRNRDLREM